MGRPKRGSRHPSLGFARLRADPRRSRRATSQLHLDHFAAQSSVRQRLRAGLGSSPAPPPLGVLTIDILVADVTDRELWLRWAPSSGCNSPQIRRRPSNPAARNLRNFSKTLTTHILSDNQNSTDFRFWYPQGCGSSSL